MSNLILHVTRSKPFGEVGEAATVVTAFAELLVSSCKLGDLWGDLASRRVSAAEALRL